MRGSIGAGTVWATRTFHRSGRPESDASTLASGAALELMAGGALGRGLVLGGSYLAHLAPLVRTTHAGVSRSTDGELGLQLLALALDWYPDRLHGVHVGVSFGGARLRSTGASDEGCFDARGPAATFSLGEDFRAGARASIGFLGRLLMMSASEQGSLRDITLSPTIVYAASASFSLAYQ